jgi:Ca2+-binding EF-hand superfamily protein
MLVKMSYKGGGGVTRTELDEVMAVLDQDGDGDIHFEEFADWSVHHAQLLLLLPTLLPSHAQRI